MTLDDILANVADQDRGRPLSILDPWSGKPIGMIWYIAGPDSDAQRRARIEMMDELADRAEPDGTVTGESREKARLNALAKSVLRWDMEGGQEPVAFSHKNVLRFLKAGTWLQAQVDAFAGDRSKFQSDPSFTDPEKLEAFLRSEVETSPNDTFVDVIGRQNLPIETRSAAAHDHLDLSLRFDAPNDAGEFSGYAVIWDERNSHNEIVQRGAFRKTLLEHRAAGTRPVMLWSHDTSAVIGVWTELREDDKGLFVRGQLVMSTTRGREAFDLLKAGALNGLSIGFRARADKRGANGVRVLTDIDVREISLVGMPSAGNARIHSVRSYGRPAGSAAAFIDACRKAKCALTTKGK